MPIEDIRFLLTYFLFFVFSLYFFLGTMLILTKQARVLKKRDLYTLIGSLVGSLVVGVDFIIEGFKVLSDGFLSFSSTLQQSITSIPLWIIAFSVLLFNFFIFIHNKRMKQILSCLRRNKI